MRANYQQLVKAHQQVARNLGNEKEDENSKISKIYLWKGADSDGRPCSWRDKIPSVSGRLDHLKLYIVVHRRNSGFHGLPLPIVQPASLDAQLCRAFRLRFLLDRGTVQTRGSPGAKKEKHCFFVAAHNVFFQGPDLLNTETDRERRRREKSKPTGSGLPVVQIELLLHSTHKTSCNANMYDKPLKEY